MRWTLSFALCLACAGALAADLSYDEAKLRADSDEASLSQDQAQVLIAAQAQAAQVAFSQCPPESARPDLSPFSLVMELDASGRIART